MINFNEKRPLKIYVIDDEEEICKGIQDHMEQQDDIHFIGYTVNPLKAFNVILDNLPHVIVVDLVLKEMPGMMVIRKIRDLPLEINPFIIVLSDDLTTLTSIKSINSGANIHMHKAREKTAEYLLDEIIHLESQIEAVNLKESEKPKSATEEKEVVVEGTRLEKKMTSILLELGMQPKYSGFKYIIYAVKMCVDYGDKELSITKEIYPTIAKKYNKKPQDIERAIRTAIERTWGSRKTDVLERLYRAPINPEAGVPTNFSFIRYYSTMLQNDYGTSTNRR